MGGNKSREKKKRKKGLGWNRRFEQKRKQEEKQKTRRMKEKKRRVNSLRFLKGIMMGIYKVAGQLKKGQTQTTGTTGQKQISLFSVLLLCLLLDSNLRFILQKKPLRLGCFANCSLGIAVL